MSTKLNAVSAERTINLIQIRLGEMQQKVIKLTLKAEYQPSTGIVTATIGNPKRTMYVNRTTGQILKNLCKSLLEGHGIIKEDFDLYTANIVMLDQANCTKNGTKRPDVQIMYSLYLAN